MCSAVFSFWRASRSPQCVSFGIHLPAQTAPSAPHVDPALFADMKWRNIGPYRAGRTKAAAGHASQPHTFYIGMVNGGVWKTTDAGRTWKPIFDDQPTGSIGWVAVAPSDPERRLRRQRRRPAAAGLAVGDGIYRSADAGKTWTHLGLRDAQQIPQAGHRSEESRTGSSSPRSGIPTGRTRNAASSARSTAARPSSACCSRTRTPAARTSTSIRRTPTSSTPRCGSSGRGRGRTARGTAPTAACSSRPTAARPGRR